MRAELRALLVALLLIIAVPGPARADDTTTIDDAVLRWGMSNEANNAAFAQGTYNFFSAGKIADPGRSNVKLTQAGWKQKSGDVAIEKWNGTSYRPATWAGLSTDKDGVTISGPGSGRYSDHQFVFSGGTGTVDRATGTAHLTWTGDVTVLFYSGYTFFYLSDPVLDVADGHGTITATLSGYGSSRDDGTWKTFTPQTVTVADLPSVDLADENGLTVTPAYDDVTTTLDGVATTGSFPQSFVGFMDQAGTAPFWMKSGSSTDAAKKALPVTISYDSSTPVDVPPPAEHTPAPTPTNSTPERPLTVTRTITRTTTVTSPAAVPPVAATQAPLTTSPVVQLVASTTTRPAPADTTWGWWLGGIFLAAAAAVLLTPSRNPRP